MANPKFKPQRAATVLAWAAFHTDDEAAAHFDVSVRSIANWRRRLKTDEEFAGIFHYKQQEFARRWDQQLDQTIAKALLAAEECLSTIDKSKAESLIAINETVAVLAEFKITREMIDARVSETNSIQGTTGKPLATTTEALA